jgi:hypothetical protein
MMMSLERFIVLCVIVVVVCGLNDLLYFALLKGQTTQWSTKDRQHNGQQRTDNTMVNKGQTTQWSTKDRQHNGQQRTFVLSVLC